jgi:SAM-dependent methyltransferase
MDRTTRQAAQLARLLGSLRRRALVLDLGCGDGSGTRYLQDAAPDHEIIGVDWSSSALDRARRRGVAVIRADLTGRLPFEDGYADVVVLGEVIEHLVDPDHTMDEIRRVLCPGGYLLLSTPNLASWFNRLLLLVGIQPVFSEVSLRGIYGRPGQDVVGHLRLYTRRALVSFLEASGFADVQVHGARFEAMPRVSAPIDRLFARLPAAAAILLAVARRA